MKNERVKTRRTERSVQIAKRAFGIISVHSFQTHTSHPGSKTERMRRETNVCVHKTEEFLCFQESVYRISHKGLFPTYFLFN